MVLFLGTGTGKTFSFAIPLVERLQEAGFNSKKPGRNPQVLVMAPTRELAKQIGDDFESISDGLSILCVYGGTPYYTQGKFVLSGFFWTRVSRHTMKHRAKHTHTPLDSQMEQIYILIQYITEAKNNDNKKK